MSNNPFLHIIEGHEDEDFRQKLPEGADYGEHPLVSVWVCAYNHEKYIRECLEGVVCQKTDFPFEVIVTDDGSTDSTQAIIREYAERYPTLIRPVLGKQNMYSRGRRRSIEQFLPLARGKYVSFCEGDDYWTYEGRLQALADFLETHPRHAMCFHAYQGLNEVEGLEANYPRLRRPRNVGRFEVVIEPHVHFASLMGRRSILVNDDDYLYNRYDSARFNYYDIRTFMIWLNAGKIYGFTEYWSIYRVHKGGVYTQLRLQGKAEEDHIKKLESLQKLYKGKFSKLADERRAFTDLHSRLDNWTYSRRDGKYLKAFGILAKAFAKHPGLFIYTYYHRYIH